jgi:hypothetical protein
VDIDPQEHFRYLIDTPGFEPVFAAIFARAKAATVDGDQIVVDFGEGEKLHASPPAAPDAYSSWPAGFQALVAHHEYLSFPDDDGWCLTLGDVGTFESSYLENSELADDRAGILVPLTDYSDWWLYHPSERNSHGEPGICYFSHEGGDVDAPVELNPGALFLSRMASTLGLDIPIPDGMVTAEPTARLVPVTVTAEPLGRDLLDDHGRPVDISLAFTDPARRHLFTVQAQRLAVYDLERATRLTATLDLPHRPDPGSHVEFLGDDLFIMTSRGWIRIALPDGQAPRVVGSFGADWGRTAGLPVGDRVLACRYQHGTQRTHQSHPERDEIPGGDGYVDQPLDGGPSSIRMLNVLAYSYAQCCARIGDRAFFAGQRWLHTFDLADPGRPVRTHELGYDGNGVALHAVADQDLLVLFETEDHGKFGVVTIDVTGVPKRLSRLLKFACPQVWTWDGADLWLLVTDKDQSVGLARARIDRSGSTGGVVASVPLDGRSFRDVRWMHVVDDTLTVLFADGVLASWQKR